MDTDRLSAVGCPAVAEIFRFYRANLEVEADGCLHVPLSTRPDYQENRPEAWCKDPNCDTAMIRRCCDWLREMESSLGIDELAASAADVHDKLSPCAVEANGALCLRPGKLLDESHRHPSQLMVVHPAMHLTIEGDNEERREPPPGI